MKAKQLELGDIVSVPVGIEMTRSLGVIKSKRYKDGDRWGYDVQVGKLVFFIFTPYIRRGS